MGNTAWEKMGNKLEIKLGDKVGDTVAIFFSHAFFRAERFLVPSKNVGGRMLTIFILASLYACKPTGNP